MRKIPIHDLRDSARLSFALNEALNFLRKSQVRLTANHLCLLFNMDAADLSRMRRLHAYPKYRQVVCKFKMWKVLHYLLERFPTLVLRENAKGELVVNLYKQHAGKKLIKSLDDLMPPARPFQSLKEYDVICPPPGE